MTSPKKLGKLARLIRSKNAGPFWLTFDIMFANDADFERVVSAKIMTDNWIARTYQVPEDSVIFVGIFAAQSHKIFISATSHSGWIQEKPTCISDSNMHH